METNYLQDSSHFGNVLKGFEGFLSSSKNTTKYETFDMNILLLLQGNRFVCMSTLVLLQFFCLTGRIQNWLGWSF